MAHPDDELLEARLKLGRVLPPEVLKRAVDASPVTIVVTDVDGNILYANPRFTRITGYSLQEAAGLNPRVLQSGHHPKEHYAAMWHTIKIEKREWHGTFKNKKKDGSFYWEEAWINPVLDAEGRIQYFVAVKEDITSRIRIVERAKELQRLMIPQELPRVGGLDLAALYLPSEDLSGDVFTIREAAGKLAVVLVDCTGHGVEASMNANLVWRHLHDHAALLHDSPPVHPRIHFRPEPETLQPALRRRGLPRHARRRARLGDAATLAWQCGRRLALPDPRASPGGV